VESWRGLPAILTEQIAHFFQHYKDLEKGKSTHIVGWAEPEETAELIRRGMELARIADAKAGEPARLGFTAKA
jgi:inorganic pyrophosphatase